MKHFPIVFNFILVLAVMCVADSVYYFLYGLPYRGYVLISAICQLISLIMRQSETSRYPPIQTTSASTLPLMNDHIAVALDEMKRSARRSGEAIIGFRVDR